MNIGALRSSSCVTRVFHFFETVLTDVLLVFQRKSIFP